MKAKSSSTYVESNGLLTPAVRILLNSKSPRSIREILVDYDVTGLEKGVAMLLKEEENGEISKVSFKKVDSVQPGSLYQLKGFQLLPRDISLTAGVIAETAPNVDLTVTKDDGTAEKHTGCHTLHRLYMAAAFRLLLGNKDTGNTGVAALIVSKEGKILAWGKKNPAHPMLHAETSAILAYGDKLPRGARVYSTLRPCKMCRAFISHYASENDFLVFYGQDDPSQAAAGSSAEMEKYINFGNRALVTPIWAEEERHRPKEIRDTISSQLSRSYNQKQRIIEFIATGKANPHLAKMAGYLTVKMKKYNIKEKNELNPNVYRSLAHINEVLGILNLPKGELKEIDF